MLRLALMSFAIGLLVSGQVLSGENGRTVVQQYTEHVPSRTGEEVSFEMVFIPGGTFQIGSQAGEAGRRDDEGPQQVVRLDPFYLATTEVTLKLFLAFYRETNRPQQDVWYSAGDGGAKVDAVTGPTPVYGDLTMGRGEKNPATGMTWQNAVVFCQWLSRKTGRQYRLPTEAEWEYACRGGTKTIFGFGNDSARLPDFAWYRGSSRSGTHPVGQKQPNRWGLYDLQGNVSEWVYDFYSPEAYSDLAKESENVNPTGPKSGKVHVARGGSYRSTAEELRCAARDYEQEWWRSGDPQLPKSKWWLPSMDHIGLRIARSVELNELPVTFRAGGKSSDHRSSPNREGAP